jgi:hypothetical protein
MRQSHFNYSMKEGSNDFTSMNAQLYKAHDPKEVKE